MHRVVVIGGVHHDRIWQLDEPLTRGRRLRFSARGIRIGGGGFHTGCQLLERGAAVTMVTSLAQDEKGLAALAALKEAGFDTRHVTMTPGETVPLEILLEPDGERTILARAHRSARLFSANGPLMGDAVYINALRLDEALVATLRDIPLAVSQLPLGPAVPRPVDYVVSSRADAGADLPSAWQRAVAIAGPRLKMLVLTDGPRRIALHDGHRTVEVETAPAVTGVSTIGAGDRFSAAFLLGLLDGLDEALAASTASRTIADWLRRRQFP
ncbi:sugar/nucleoside kinase (ribokinase family) [Pseudochelatococcus lubricantis]|uniref:Sugar/nucleoside kinase (Ribokinase family) n=1 Tax=Pseudochelatococcus lubricantis TaxID=1538102 RepID=A0ABX0UXB1_9HYPH|nr:PfkB family carbohydrate kinase [Pseudochelatococcus lubricantis]NIJ57577.1 sugar/nucleoside kinase (ribokinase family) [Pseudochelatococcus lubricantis]